MIRTVLEPGERLRALRLRAIAVNAFGLDPVGHQLRRQAVGAMLRTREHQRLRHVAALEKLHQQRTLEFLRHRIHRLRDTLGRRRLTLQVECHRLVQHFLRQRRNRCRHCRAEKQRLTFPVRQMPQDFLDLWQETHVEHPIGFVQH